MLTPTELESEKRSLAGEVWRVVEHQYEVSTRKLVDSDSEQELLEKLLEEEAKPPIPRGAAHLDYLLMTPYRYQPVKPWGSRFRRPGSGPGVFYAAEHIPTALAEFAYYRFKFFLAAPDAVLPQQAMSLSVFSAVYATDAGLDLTVSALSQHRDVWIANDYSGTQILADTAREVAIEAIRYESARDPQHRANVAILEPGAFSDTKPQSMQTWKLYLSEDEASFRRPHSVNSPTKFVFRKHEVMQEAG
jgi:hypothetical protein